MKIPLIDIFRKKTEEKEQQQNQEKTAKPISLSHETKRHRPVEKTKSAIPQKGAASEDTTESIEILNLITIDHLSPRMRTAMSHAKWPDLMPVQSKTIPYILAKRDAMIQSRTGSGKTGAFILPILDLIDVKRHSPQLLVLVPTRELALQVTQQTEILCTGSGLLTTAIYGGVGYEAQIKGLRSGTQLIVGTPGRILDHLLKGTLSLDSLQLIIFDEADRLLSMGFYQDMKEIQKYLPSRHINAYMFSATFPPFVINLSQEFLHKPEFISLSKDQIHVAETEHSYFVIPSMQKDRALTRIIEIENPEQAIIFCNTKSQVHYVAVVLQRFGYNADELSSDISQSARERVMERLRNGNLRLLVATDVAARGIDIPQLSHVIQYEPPTDHDLYIHRTGRTGRAGASGLAISLVNEVEQMDLERIARQFQINLIEKALPTQEDVNKILKERLIVLLEKHLREQDNLVKERMQRFLPLAQDLAQSEEGPLLFAMLLDEYYHQVLHAPPFSSLIDKEKATPIEQNINPYRKRHRSPRSNFKKKR